jgi:hypothetical protein
MLHEALKRLPAQVEAVKSGIAAFEIRDDP